MSLANDYFLLYHGTTFEQNLDVEPIDAKLTMIFILFIH